ncbi:MAG: hypothetical protein KBS89_00545 [Bacteroidales bacterium]|nr:hypothetical protein [Candidatus Egerieousia equi]
MKSFKIIESSRFDADAMNNLKGGSFFCPRELGYHPYCANDKVTCPVSYRSCDASGYIICSGKGSTTDHGYVGAPGPLGASEAYLSLE